jgi:hypothetical protein
MLYKSTDDSYQIYAMNVYEVIDMMKYWHFPAAGLLKSYPVSEWK